MSDMALKDFGSKGDNFHEILFAKFTCDRSEDSGAAGVEILIDDYYGITVKAKIGTILATYGMTCADNDSAHDISFLDGASGGSFLHVGGDDISDASRKRAFADNANHGSHTCAGVISDIEARADLDHCGLLIENRD